MTAELAWVGREEVEVTRDMVKATGERGVGKIGRVNETGGRAELKRRADRERDCNGA